MLDLTHSGCWYLLYALLTNKVLYITIGVARYHRSITFLTTKRSTRIMLGVYSCLCSLHAPTAEAREMHSVHRHTHAHAHSHLVREQALDVVMIDSDTSLERLGIEARNGLWQHLLHGLAEDLQEYRMRLIIEFDKN